MASDQQEILAQNSTAGDQPIRTLESDILAFTATLPYWAQYLSEKILAGVQLAGEQYAQAYHYFLEDVGLEKATEERPKIDIICKSNTGGYKTDLQLLKVSGVEGINALVPGQTLELCPQLTIIYGSNGSGKSGYIRLLNNVFITKGEKTILPNIHESAAVSQKAQFEFSSTGSNYTLHFPTDCAKSEFKQFSVFDEKAVHAHLNNKNQFEFRPSGLAYFAELNESYKKMEELVSEDIRKREQTIDVSALFDGESAIKTLIGQLSAKTKLEIFNEYKVFSDENKAERIKLEEKKAALMALKKDKEILDLSQHKKQLLDLKNSLANVNRYFSADQLTKATANIQDCVKKEGLAATNNIAQFKTSPLESIGLPEWRNFITAADAFARQQDKEGALYPNPDDICLLCHQPLSTEASQLVAAYWGFIKSKAEQDSKDAQAKLENSRDYLLKLELNLLPDTSTLYKWLSENRVEDLKTIVGTLKKIVAVRDQLVNCLLKKEVQEFIPAQGDLILIDKIVELVDKKTAELEEADVSKEIVEIQQQITLLNHKEKLKDHFATVEKRVANLDWIAKAQKGKISKRDITNREKELSGIYFNQAYIDKFNLECQQLNGDFGISINHTGSAGTSYRQLNLKGKQPTEILSEGEQKVISLADFLSETILSGVNRGMIFDDPVTSLDEERKAQIAERLATESVSRQVVVFTHDLVFVSQLIGVCQDTGKSHVCHWIEQRDGKPGYVSLKNSPSYEKEYKTPEKPTNLYLQAKKPDCPAAMREMLIQQGFTSLRTCYETLVVFGFFQGVVQRFVERVSVESLKTVNIDQPMKDELMDSFGLCCRHMEGHSHSDQYAYRKPKLEDLDTEIKRFDVLRLKIAAFNKAEAKR